MAEFGPDIASEVLAACKEGLAETTEALNRTLESELELELGEAATIDLEALPEEFSGPGLMVVLKVEDSAALVLLPESSGLLPDWYKAPDATGTSKLATLAQELGMLLLPEAFMPMEFEASRVENLDEALRRGEVASGAGWVPIKLKQGEQSGVLSLVWPAAKADAVIEAAKEAEEGQGAKVDDGSLAEKAMAEPKSTATADNKAAVGKADGQQDSSPQASPKHPNFQEFEDGLHVLPYYTRSLLKVKTPVKVSLASAKQPLNKIVELGPGAIIQFDTSCEEMLTLEVGDQCVAVGEAVKVGDKFGLRITQMILPEERFWVAKGKEPAPSRRVK